MAEYPEPIMTNPPGDIDAFLAGDLFAVVGASADRAKYGNKVLRAYLQGGRRVYPVNPRGGEIEGLASYPDLATLPEKPHGVSIITPPAVTERVVAQAVELGIGHVWLQPGAESDSAIRLARKNGLNIIARGPCALVVMGYHE